MRADGVSSAIIADMKRELANALRDLDEAISEATSSRCELLQILTVIERVERGEIRALAELVETDDANKGRMMPAAHE